MSGASDYIDHKVDKLTKILYTKCDMCGKKSEDDADFNAVDVSIENYEMFLQVDLCDDCTNKMRKTLRDIWFPLEV